MTDAGAIVHLTRANGLIKDVEEGTESFRRQATTHTEGDNSDEPFLQGMIATIKGGRNLSQRKDSFTSDLNLAEQEIIRAVTLDPEACLHTTSGTESPSTLRCHIALLRGQLEMIWGGSDQAILYFQASRSFAETAPAHYMLGLVYESQNRPADALSHFEQCLALEPSGEYSVPALRAANAMRNYRRRFRGSWGMVFLLLVVFFPAAFVYVYLKWK